MGYRKLEILQETRVLRTEHCCPGVGRGTKYTYADLKIEELTPQTK